jgi:hypothetical protein
MSGFCPRRSGRPRIEDRDTLVSEDSVLGIRGEQDLMQNGETEKYRDCSMGMTV